MRGSDEFIEQLFTVKRLDEFVPADHPLRPICSMVNEALARLDGLFSQMYTSSIKGGRPSIAPEKLLRAMLLQVFYSVRPERQLMDHRQYNLLYRWFIGLSMDAEVWVPKLIEQGFGWAKVVDRIRQTIMRGLNRVDQAFTLNMEAYNLVRMRNLGRLRVQQGFAA